jgi:hypothetical protein
MWVLFARAPLPDARPWPGRRALAVIDAVLWPVAIAFLAATAEVPLGAIGQLAIAICPVLAVQRAYRAIAHNHRYRFTTWRWGRRFALPVALGYGLMFAVSLAQ